MRNCPDEYYKQCANALKKCKVCAAGSGSTSSKVLYKSTTGELLFHPHTPNIKKQKRLKEAKRVEDSQRIAIANSTIRSGALLGDGDTSLLRGTLRMETKDRGVRKSWNLTLEEYEKGKQQGIDIYGITIKHPETGKQLTMYMIEERMAGLILALIKNQQEREER